MAAKKPNPNPAKLKPPKASTKKAQPAKPSTKATKATTARVTKAKLKARKAAETFVTSAGNASAVARAAGSKAKRSRQAGHEILTKPDVQVEITQILAQVRSDAVMEATEVLERLTEQARFDLTKYQSKTGALELERIKEEGKGHCLVGFRSRYNKKTKVLTVEGMAASQQKALFKLADVYGLPQQPRTNTFETVRKAVADYMVRESVGLIAAINRLKDEFPVVRKYEAQLLEAGA